jgi:hypothetical protein
MRNGEINIYMYIKRENVRDDGCHWDSLPPLLKARGEESAACKGEVMERDGGERRMTGKSFSQLIKSYDGM